uniref:Uncharacterized protein n=1 Tax=Lotharella oceanica TaxID=641309 RepID=A0A7S2XJ53_9EUKA|mmetsp:Transcript_5784/g.11460  ORF Transcript_5784/g.11460 Transcript_5784/m.11460 type:complete len:284 (+) Transcript_5784:89-940(+)
MGITISFENDTDQEFEVSIQGQLTGVTVARKRMKPGELWTKTDEGLSAGYVYNVRLEDLNDQAAIVCKVQAPAMKGETRYKLSDLMEGESKGIVISSTTPSELASEVMTGAMQAVGMKSPSVEDKPATKDIGEPATDATDATDATETTGKKEGESGGTAKELNEEDLKQENLKEEVKEPPSFTKLELRMLKSRHPTNAEEREAFKSALAKKYHLEREKNHYKADHTKEIMAQNKEMAHQRGKELKQTEDRAGDMEAQAKDIMKTFKDLRIKNQNADPLSFLNF